MIRSSQRPENLECGVRNSECTSCSFYSAFRIPHSALRLPVASSGGFTLIELMMGASIMTIVIVALMGAFFGQSFLNTNARNLTVAMTDATRVMEQIRRQNIGCATATPSIVPPGSFTSWNQWLNASVASGGGGGKGINQPGMFEHVAVTCQDGSSGAARPPSCRSTSTPADSQMGAQEWAGQNTNPIYNPLRVTVAVGWLQSQRAIGAATGGQQEFVYVETQPALGTGKMTVNPSGSGSLVAADANNNGVIESQAMLTTLVTCR